VFEQGVGIFLSDAFVQYWDSYRVVLAFDSGHQEKLLELWREHVEPLRAGVARANEDILVQMEVGTRLKGVVASALSRRLSPPLL
jgi:hypothetical protein